MTAMAIGGALAGCAAPPPPVSVAPTVTTCIGDSEPPAALAGKLQPIDDPALLAAALGAPGKGGLCQGRAYQVKADTSITLYRGWNSTNPNSRLGKWWAATNIAGSVAQYSHDYEICYQWSPLDKATECQFRAGTKLVIGTGQSAECSKYLSYPVSASKQVFLSKATDDNSGCADFDGQFSWQPVAADTSDTATDSHSAADSNTAAN